MKTLRLALLPFMLIVCACQKKPDPPAPATEQTVANPNPPTPPTPVTNCQGATVMYSLPAGQTINDNSSKDFTIPNFEQSCGDSVQVFMRKPGVATWTEYFTVDNGASYYSITNQVVTLHNRTGIVLEVDIEAVLK